MPKKSMLETNYLYVKNEFFFLSIHMSCPVSTARTYYLNSQTDEDYN